MKLFNSFRPFLMPALVLSGALMWNAGNRQMAVAAPPQASPQASPQAPVAPALAGQSWLNTPQNLPLSLQARRGQVTIVEFWTFGCSNCRANLPAYAKWARDFKARGVEVIGVHTPETPAERDPQNVAAQVKSLGIAYPIVLDPKMENWNRWSVRYWPTIFLIDKQGRVRQKWEGELEYGGAGGTAKLTKNIETLLAE